MSNSESESTQVIFEETKRLSEIDTTEEQEEEEEELNKRKEKKRKENKSYQLHKEYEDFVSLVGPSNLTKDKGGYAFIMPVNWIELIETPIAAYERDLNGSLGLNDQLSLNKGRYYPEYL